MGGLAAPQLACLGTHLAALSFADWRVGNGQAAHELAETHRGPGPPATCGNCRRHVQQALPPPAPEDAKGCGRNAVGWRQAGLGGCFACYCLCLPASSTSVSSSLTSTSLWESDNQWCWMPRCLECSSMLCPSILLLPVAHSQSRLLWMQ